MKAACAEAHCFCRLGEQFSARLVRRGDGVEEVAVCFCVRARPLPFISASLDLTRNRHAGGDFS